MHKVKPLLKLCASSKPDIFLRKMDNNSNIVFHFSHQNHSNKISHQLIAAKNTNERHHLSRSKLSLQVNIKNTHEFVNKEISNSLLSKNKKIDKNLAERFIIQERKTYISAYINSMIDTQNLGNKNNYHYNISPTEKKQIFKIIDEKYHLNLGDDCVSLAQSSIKQTVVNDKNLNILINKFAAENTDKNIEEKNNIRNICLNEISENIFKNYYPEVLLDDIKKDVIMLMYLNYDKKQSVIKR